MCSCLCGVVWCGVVNSTPFAAVNVGNGGGCVHNSRMCVRLLFVSQSRLAIMQAKMTDVNNLVKVKNPSLLLQLAKGPRGTRGHHGGGHFRG